MASGAAFLVLAVLGNRIGQEIIQPLAIVMLGGLVTSTFISLFVLPAMYTRFVAQGERRVPETRLDVSAATA